MFFWLMVELNTKSCYNSVFIMTTAYIIRYIENTKIAGEGGGWGGKPAGRLYRIG